MTSHWPLAPAYGAQQRVLHIARILSRFATVSFVLVPSEIEDEETALKSRSEFEICRIIRPERDKRKKTVADRMRHELDPDYTATDPYVVSDADRSAVR